MARTFVIGDIHGALKALQQVIAAIKPTTDDTLIFLGDYVDGWPESAQVIEFLIGLKKQYDCIFIKGNHDILCADWLMGKLETPAWITGRGKPTIESYRHITERDKQKHIIFFSSLSLFHIDGENRLFLHAGFSDNDGPQFEIPETNLTEDRSLWELAITMEKRIHTHPELFPKRLKLFKEIFIGHTPTLILNSTAPVHACNVWNMDTGAGFHGPLSAMEIHSRELIQSEAVVKLYPGHTGRND
ncbi:MAG: metallophosphoesterase family protein [Chitinophagaceae bacterium]